MQLVLSNNRIIAHGENFLAMGGVVINTETGAKYENATIAECNGCPSDIDKVGYEYHAGVFVPCAPFGIGTGTVAVYCGDCKTPRDSGLHIDDVSKKITLLWENASASSAFGAQTITLSSDDWDVLIVQSRGSLADNYPFGGGATIVTEKTRVTSGLSTYTLGKGMIVEVGSSSSATNITIGYREVEAEGKKVTFGSCKWVRVTSSNVESGSGAHCIPYKIYGVKL